MSNLNNLICFINTGQGGIALLVNKNISKYVTILETKWKLVRWFVDTNIYTNLEQEIMCGTIYIPPENSSYATDDPFLEIQLELNDIIQLLIICLYF